MKINALLNAEDLKKKLDLKNGEKGDKGDKGDTTIVEKIIIEQPIVKEVAVTDTALQIADKLNLEEGIIEQKVIIGLEDSLNKKVTDGIQRGGGSGGVFLYVDGAKKGKVNSIDFAGATYSKVNGLDTVTVATDLSGYLKLDQSTPQTVLGGFSVTNGSNNLKLFGADSGEGIFDLGTTEGNRFIVGRYGEGGYVFESVIDGDLKQKVELLDGNLGYVGKFTSLNDQVTLANFGNAMKLEDLDASRNITFMTGTYTYYDGVVSIGYDGTILTEGTVLASSLRSYGNLIIDPTETFTDNGSQVQVYDNNGVILLNVDSPTGTVGIGKVASDYKVSTYSDVKTAGVFDYTVAEYIADITITGTLNPDSTGTYIYKGQYTGRNYYQRGSDSWYLWSDGTTYWRISPATGNASTYRWYATANTALPPTGAYVPTGGATGTATLAFAATSTSSGTTIPLLSLDYAGLLKLNYNTANYTTFNVDSAGNLIIVPTASKILIGDNLNHLPTAMVNASKVGTGGATGGGSFRASKYSTEYTHEYYVEMSSSGFTIDANQSWVFVQGGYNSLVMNQTAISIYSNNGIEAIRVNGSGVGNNNVGFNTSAPDKQVEINSATGACLRLTNNDSNGTATNYCDFSVDANGDTTITSSGGDVTIGGGGSYFRPVHTQTTGDIYLSCNSSTTSAPRILGFNNFSTGEASRFQFADAFNCLQVTYGQAMTLKAYHTLFLRGGSAVTNVFDNTISTVGTIVDNDSAARIALVVDGADAQTGNLQVWSVNTNGATPLASMSPLGNFFTNGNISAGTATATSKAHVVGDVLATTSFVAGNSGAPSTVMTANNAPSPYVVSASSEYNATYAAWKAFDRSATTEWATLGDTTDFWLKIDLGASYYVPSATVSGRGSEYPTNWRIEGSNDDTNWVTVYSQASAMGGTAVLATFSAPGSYRYYRMFAITGNGTNPGMREFMLTMPIANVSSVTGQTSFINNGGKFGLGTNNPQGFLDVATSATSGLYVRKSPINESPQFVSYGDSGYLYFLAKNEYTSFNSLSANASLQIENGSTGYSQLRFLGSSDNRITTGAGDLTLTTAADKTLVLGVVVWEDIRINIGNISRPGGSDPAWVAYNVNGGGINTYLLEFAKNDSGTFTVQLPHGYKQGTDIAVHAHWTPGANGATESGKYVGWKLQYSWANINGTFGTMATVDLSDACDGTNHKHQMTPDVTIDGHTAAKNISSMLICNIIRTDTGADDDWAGTASGALPMLLEVDFHYQIDTLGSRTQAAK